MGRTMERERKKQHTSTAPTGGVTKGKGKGKVAAGNQNNPTSHTALVSAAFARQSWSEVMKALENMRRAGETPKLGTVQRWVRLADLSGDERVAAAVLACVMRCIPGSAGPVAAMSKAQKKSKSMGPIRRHPPWSPPLNKSQVWFSANAPPSASLPSPPPDYPSLISLVPQDGSTQPAKRPPNWSELTIWQLTPGTIRYMQPDPQVVRVDVPFVPGAFVLTGLLTPDECRQLVAASTACGYRWDVDYTFNPSNPDSATAQDHTPSSQPPTTNQLDRGILSAQETSGAPHASACSPSKQEPQPLDVKTATNTESVDPGTQTEQLEQAENDLVEPQPVKQGEPGQQGEKGDEGQQPQGEHGPQGPQVQQGEQGQQGEEGHEGQQPQGEQGPQGQEGQDQGQQYQGQHTGVNSSHNVQHPLLSAARTIAGGDRAAGCVIIADDSLIGPIFRRAAPHLPQKIGGKPLAGINARLRFYRYDSGNVYRPHVDGAWPGSGIVDGKLVHDAYGDRWSHLTFLVYLNDDFEGGSTTFFAPALDDKMALDARGVQPRTGNVLCFPHGDTVASLVHEGSAVTKGAKYVIRTDVLYMT